VGSRSKTQLAYIAGFLDGDGSLMLQLKKRSDGKVGYRLMCTICFYQDTRHEKPLHYIRRTLGIGYISRRNDGMSELRINGFAQTVKILQMLIPFIRFKKVQANALLNASELLSQKTVRSLSRQYRKKLIGYMIAIQNENYSTRRKRSVKEFERVFGLTP